MAIINYKLVRGRSVEELEKNVAALLGTHQPLGGPILDHDNRLFCQAMTTGGGVIVTDGMELKGVEPTGEYIDTVTFTVEDGEITEVTLS
jgi:hypothetical protein